MSNHLAIATVTEALRQLLSAAVSVDVSGAEARVSRLGAAGSSRGLSEDAGVNVFLYRVIPNPALRNQDLPTRRGNGSTAQRPTVALDLNYLLTFHGNESELEPQRTLGSAVRVLHSKPLLTRSFIESVVASAPYLSGSDLADEVERVKFTPLPLNLEELSKLWSALFQTPYTLSLAYQASVVLIEAEDSSQESLPVREWGLYVRPFRHPSIDRVTSEPPEGEPRWADQPILPGHSLVLTGRQLLGELTRVRLGREEVEPASVSDTRVTLPLSSPPLPAGALRAGVQTVQLVQPISMGVPPEPRAGFESNLAAFVLRPVFGSDDIAVVDTLIDSTPVTELKVSLRPKAREGQRAVLLLNELGAAGEPKAYRFSTLIDVDETDTVSFVISDGDGDCVVPTGDYLVRLQVDGAESPLEIEGPGEYVEPRVSIL